MLGIFLIELTAKPNLNAALSGDVVVLLLTSHANGWVFKPSQRQVVQATKL